MQSSGHLIIITIAWDYEIILGFMEKSLHEVKKSCTCTRESLWQIAKAKLPILSWLIGYDFKNWLVGDLIAGITIAIFHIPQGQCITLFCLLLLFF